VLSQRPRGAEKRRKTKSLRSSFDALAPLRSYSAVQPRLKQRGPWCYLWQVAGGRRIQWKKTARKTRYCNPDVVPTFVSRQGRSGIFFTAGSGFRLGWSLWPALSPDLSAASSAVAIEPPTRLPPYTHEGSKKKGFGFSYAEFPHMKNQIHPALQNSSVLLRTDAELVGHARVQAEDG